MLEAVCMVSLVWGNLDPLGTQQTKRVSLLIVVGLLFIVQALGTADDGRRTQCLRRLHHLRLNRIACCF